MAAFGNHLGAGTVYINRFARAQDGAGGLDGNRHFQVLARADAAHNAARIVAAKALGAHRVPMHRAALRHAGKACTDFHALDGIQAHHGVSNVGIQLVIQRLA